MERRELVFIVAVLIRIFWLPASLPLSSMAWSKRLGLPVSGQP
jgi:hypothetical protein